MGTLKLYRTGVGWEVIGTAPRGAPPGGAANALLAKVTSADGDVAWTTAPIVTGMGVGTTAVASTVTFADAYNLSFGAATGTKFGTSSLQKMGWWNATPVAQSTGWSVTAGYAALKAFNPQTMTMGELARVVGTLVDTLKTYGLLST